MSPPKPTAPSPTPPTDPPTHPSPPPPTYPPTIHPPTTHCTHPSPHQSITMYNEIEGTPLPCQPVQPPRHDALSSTSGLSTASLFPVAALCVRAHTESCQLRSFREGGERCMFGKPCVAIEPDGINGIRADIRELYEYVWRAGSSAAGRMALPVSLRLLDFSKYISKLFGFG